jgi:xylulokinase
MAAADALFVAVDAGTTGARAVAVTGTGHVVHESRRAYATATPHAGWAEQNPSDWRNMALAAVGDLVDALGGAPARERIAAIGLTGQCPTVAPFDGTGEPVGPGMMYRDNRANAEAALMRKRIGEAVMHARTGHLADAFHVGPKVLWLRDHRPDVFAAAECFLQPRDVVLRALTGEVRTDETHANSTVFFDLRERDWAEDLLSAFSLSPDFFPTVAAPWEVAGAVSTEIAAATGAPPGCPVVIGAADSQCAAYGSGVNEPGPISEMAGASSCLNSIVPEPLADPVVTHYSHVLPDRFCTELGVNTTGAAVQWAVSRLAFEDYATLESAAAHLHTALREGAYADPIAAAPLFLPYLGDGERNDVTLRGGFIGLADRHGRDALAYAVLEGIAFSVASVIEVLTSAGAPFDELRVAGGATRLPVLGAIKADALAVPVVHLEADTAAVGVALLAAAGTGHRAEAEDGIDGLVRRAVRLDPVARGIEILKSRREWFQAVRASRAVRLTPPPTEGSGS